MLTPTFIAFVLVALAVGGVAYVVLDPLLSGEARAAKRQKALLAPGNDRRERLAAITRREQVAQSLKELEAKQKSRNALSLEVRIAQAGLDWTPRRFMMVSILLGLGSGLMAFLVSQSGLVTLGAVFAGAFGLPRWILSYLKRRRIDRFILELPNAMDVIVRGIRSGLPLGDCLRIVANEAQEPVKSEFRAIIEAQALGLTVGEAVAKLYERVPVADANFFAIVISIQQTSGGNLSEALGNLSKVLRERKKMKDKIKAMSMEAKASAGIIGALPFAVATLTYLSSPDYITLLWTRDAGKVALVAGGLWMATGIFVMKKMISFKV